MYFDRVVVVFECYVLGLVVYVVFGYYVLDIVLLLQVFPVVPWSPIYLEG